MKLKAKVDENQAEIVAFLRSKGATVFCSHQIGKGFPDLVVGYKGKNLLIEVKNKNAKGKLTPKEKEFLSFWKGKIHVISSIEETEKLLASI